MILSTHLRETEYVKVFSRVPVPPTNNSGMISDENSKLGKVMCNTKYVFEYFTDEIFGTVAGWGLTSYNNGEISSKLQKVKVPLVPVSANACRKLLVDVHAQLCAGKNGSNFCEGDSGGPLLCHYNTGDVICGIASYGVDCHRENIPGIIAPQLLKIRVNIKTMITIFWFQHRAFIQM